VLIAADQDRVWPLPPEIDDSVKLASHLARNAEAVRELDPQLVMLVMPLGPPTQGGSPDEFRLGDVASGDYDLVALAVGQHAHVACFAASVDADGAPTGWQDMNGYMPGLAARLRRCFPDGAHAIPADSIEWAFAECCGRDEANLHLLVQAAAAESAWRARKEPLALF
jgi:hypothetical protein